MLYDITLRISYLYDVPRRAYWLEMVEFCGIRPVGQVDAAPTGDSEKKEEAPSIAEIATAVGGRVVETAGILQDDDEKIAKGKTIAANAIDD